MCLHDCMSVCVHARAHVHKHVCAHDRTYLYTQVRGDERARPVVQSVGHVIECLNSLAHGGTFEFAELLDLIDDCGAIAYKLCPAEADGHDGPEHSAVRGYVRERLGELQQLMAPLCERAKAAFAEACEEACGALRKVVRARERALVEVHSPPAGAAMDRAGITDAAASVAYNFAHCDAFARWVIGEHVYTHIHTHA